MNSIGKNEMNNVGNNRNNGPGRTGYDRLKRNDSTDCG